MRKQLVCLALVLGAQSAGAFVEHSSSLEDFEYHVNTTGISGPMCGRRKCLTGHACVDGSCECPEGTQGDARLHCAQGGTVTCTVTADPHVHAFGGALVDVDLPCRYKLARLLIPVGPAQDKLLMGCTLDVHAVNGYYNNKFYVLAVDVGADLSDLWRTDGTQFNSNIFAAIFGNGINSQRYRYATYGVRYEGFESDASLNNSLYMNLTLAKPTDDQDNNLMTMAIEKCGLGVHFRGVDTTTGGTVPSHMSQLPGISIQAPPHAYNDRHETLLCGTPGDGASLWADRAAELGLDDPKLAVIHDILVVDQPSQEVELPGYTGGHANGEVCEATIDYLYGYVDFASHVSLINTCGPILTDKDIRACVAAQVEELLYEESMMVGFYSCLAAANGEQGIECRFTKNIAVDKCGLPWDGETLQCDPPGDD